MEVEGITDHESLRAWLEGLPQATVVEREHARACAVAIAHRAAMRVLPMTWDQLVIKSSDLRNQSVAPILRASVICSTASFTLTPALVSKAASAAWLVPNNTPADFASTYACFALSAEAYSGEKRDVAVNSQGKVLTPDRRFTSFATARAASEALDAVYAFGPASAKPLMWAQVRADCTIVLEEGGLATRPLWQNENPMAQRWTDLRTLLLGLHDGWRFWVDWYDKALRGEQQDIALLTKVALIDNEDWDKGPDHVNALIAQICVEHIAETRPLGEDAIDKGADGLWHRTGRSDIDRDILQDAIDSVRDEVRALRGRLQGPQGNMLTALVSDLDLLDDRIARYPDRPLRLHDTFLSVQSHLARNLESDELPDVDCVRDLSAALATAALDMCNACEKTRSVVQARLEVRFTEADARARKQLQMLAQGAASLSNASLAAEFIEDAEVVAEAKIPLPEKRGVIYRLQTRLAKIVTVDGRNLVKALILIGGLGAGLGTFASILGAILQFLYSI